MEFTFNSITYRHNETSDRYSKTENGKTRRIGKAEYEQAHDAWVKASLAETEESVETEEVKEVARKAKKTRKSRRQVAREFEVDGQKVTLTEKQVDFIQHLPDTCYWEHGLDSTLWMEALCDEIGGQFAGKSMTVGAMISTLREKGLIYASVDKLDGKKAKYVALTGVGKIVAGEILGI